MKFIVLIFIFSLVSCSNLSQRLVKTGDFDFQGGVYKDKRWEDSLEFKRYTWFYELSIVYDLLYVNIDNNSPFFSWLSEDEKSSVAKCRHFLVALTYKNPTHSFATQILDRDLMKFGFLEISTPTFRENIRNHPDFMKWDLNYHRVKTYCQTNSKEDQAIINIPGFQQVTLPLVM